MAAATSLPQAGDRFYLQLGAIGPLHSGEVFELLDDRYSEITLRARVVEVSGDVALVEILAGAGLAPALPDGDSSGDVSAVYAPPAGSLLN